MNLSNKDNYLPELGCGYRELIKAYMVMVEYYVTTIEQTVQIDDTSYYTYILCKGLENLKNIFRLLLVYTKNKAMSTFQTEKAMLYYAEFIGQISNEHSFIINLNGKDATLFIFKKTLYDVTVKDPSMTDADITTISVMDQFIDTHSAVLDALLNFPNEENKMTNRVQMMHKKLCHDIDHFVTHRDIICHLVKRVSDNITNSQLTALIAALIKSPAPELLDDIEMDDLKELSLPRLIKRIMTTT